MYPTRQQDSILIRNKHLYRFPFREWKPANWDPNEIVFEIKLEKILDAARSVNHLQILKDLIASTRKRRREGEDGLDARQRQHQRMELESLENGLSDVD